jgi:hypothetical protein
MRSNDRCLVVSEYDTATLWWRLRIDRPSETANGAPRIKRSNASIEPPPPCEELLVVGGAESDLMTTVVLAVADGGAPAQVIEYVTVPALVSVTAIDPDVARVPPHPSPALPPEATQELEWDEFHVSEVAAPMDCVAALLDKVTPGVVTFGDDGETAVYVTVTCATSLLQLTA